MRYSRVKTIARDRLALFLSKDNCERQTHAIPRTIGRDRLALFPSKDNWEIQTRAIHEQRQLGETDSSYARLKTFGMDRRVLSPSNTIGIDSETWAIAE